MHFHEYQGTYILYCIFISFPFPPHLLQYELPNGIEELCWPDGLSWQPHSQDQTRTYTLVLTDLRGQRTFGYCRRIQAEGDDVCSPLAICILTRHSRAKGLFSQVCVYYRICNVYIYNICYKNITSSKNNTNQTCQSQNYHMFVSVL